MIHCNAFSISWKAAVSCERYLPMNAVYSFWVFTNSCEDARMPCKNPECHDALPCPNSKSNQAAQRKPCMQTTTTAPDAVKRPLEALGCCSCHASKLCHKLGLHSLPPLSCGRLVLVNNEKLILVVIVNIPISPMATGKHHIAGRV